MSISEYAIRKPITAVMVTLSLVVLGIISLFRLPLAYAPDLSWPSMYISVSYPSSSPEEIERSITRPIEEMMSTLSGVKSLSSRSYGSRCWVRMEFDYGTDMDMVSIQVRDRLDQARILLPDDVERIETRRWSSDDWEIMDYRVTWKGKDQSELLAVYKESILPRLQRLEGVGSVEIEGVDEKALLVEVDQNLLNAHNLDIRTLNRAIRANNVNISAGYVRDADRRLSVRLIGEFDDIDDIEHLTLRNNIEMADVAQVTYDYPERKSFERIDGRDAVSIEIRKASTANLVATCDRIRREMVAIQEEIGKDKLYLQLSRDQSETVVAGIWNLTQSAMIGGILAILVIFVFLRNFRSTLIIGAAIPISVLCVFVIMYLLRQAAGATITLNMVSMMGLMVAIGMLVDPAVVALENIYRKRFDEGLSATEAAIEGSREIGIPVLAAALTTICVFVPIIFVTGSSRSMWMRDFAITVCISVAASLVVALSLIPLASSRAFAGSGSRFDRYMKLLLGVGFIGGIGFSIYAYGVTNSWDWAQKNGAWFVDGLAHVPIGAWVFVGVLTLVLTGLYYRFRHIGLQALYVRVVGVTLHYRWSTISVACIVLVSGFYLYSKVEKRPYRWQSSRRVEYTVEMPRNYSLEEMLTLFGSIEDILIPKKSELDIDAVRTRVSNRRGNRITLYLVSADDATLATDEIKKRVKELLPTDIPGVRFKEGRSRGGSGTGVGIEIRGRNPDVLAVLAEDMKLRMDNIEGVHEIETSLESGTEEIRVTVNRQRAQRYGLSPRAVATSIASALGSRGSSKFKTDNAEIDITVLLQEEDRANLEQLKNTPFEDNSGSLISLATLADFSLQKGPNSIERQDRMATVQVFASTERTTLMQVGEEMRARMELVSIPKGYTWQMDRSFRQISEEQGETNFTMIFAVLLIYMIMASLFESYVHPFTIMFSICFAFTGVAIGLYAFQVAMDSNATYGLLILFGIVVNNGIVLVDHINRYRHQGHSRRDAILLGGQDRLRPILMTATTTILGLTPLVVPMIYGTAEGYARMWGPIGLVIISGLIVSALLTLVILPTIYSLMDDLTRYGKRVVAMSRVVS
ncbi:MAG: HAE1 family hydrophobic/amphiphilic exporter-1 [Candidatus Latescibacterota bacterium]|jgi:HAE1 family hydrophobic/amphiphilic exporter-1